MPDREIYEFVRSKRDDPNIYKTASEKFHLPIEEIKRIFITGDAKNQINSINKYYVDDASKVMKNYENMNFR
jgi:hypothetical protein